MPTPAGGPFDEVVVTTSHLRFDGQGAARRPQAHELFHTLKGNIASFGQEEMVAPERGSRVPRNRGDARQIFAEFRPEVR